MIGILGGGAFGTALAVSLGREGSDVRLWARDPNRCDIRRKPGLRFPATVSVTDKLGDLDAADLLLLAVPSQALAELLTQNRAQLEARVLVACCKGVDLTTGLGPSGVIRAICPAAQAALLTGPSFAVDIAQGLPTALALACSDDALGIRLQRRLSTTTLRLYRTTDVTGAELGGALKNVIAIAAGVAIGAGLGDSARAALMTRGYAEMMRLALVMGARAETLAGLSGLGDLVLTCTSAQSRNFRFGLALGSGMTFDTNITVEGIATARAAGRLAAAHRIEMPIAGMVAALIDGLITLPAAVQTLLSRPLKQE